MAELTIRAATAADFDAWLPLWRGYQAFYKTDIPHATTLTTWQRLLAPDEPMHVALAVRDEAVVGLVHYIEHRSCWTSGNYMYLQDLFVVPEGRGAGVGRRLIDHVYGRGVRARLLAGVVAHPRIQHRCHGALRPRGVEERVRPVPQAALTLN